MSSCGASKPVKTLPCGAAAPAELPIQQSAFLDPNYKAPNIPKLPKLADRKLGLKAAETNPAFNPVDVGLTPCFELTKYNRLKGCGCVLHGRGFLFVYFVCFSKNSSSSLKFFVFQFLSSRNILDWRFNEKLIDLFVAYPTGRYSKAQWKRDVCCTKKQDWDGHTIRLPKEHDFELFIWRPWLHVFFALAFMWPWRLVPRDPFVLQRTLVKLLLVKGYIYASVSEDTRFTLLAHVRHVLCVRSHVQVARCVSRQTREGHEGRGFADVQKKWQKTWADLIFFTHIFETIQAWFSNISISSETV